MKTSWSCLIGMAQPAPGMGDRTMTCIHNKGYSFLILTQPDKVFFFVFWRLKNPFTWPTRRRYNDKDAEAAAASVADHPISDTMLFGELWQKRKRGTLISLEEGALEHWHFGRTVLAGDSAHKVRVSLHYPLAEGFQHLAFQHSFTLNHLHFEDLSLPLKEPQYFPLLKPISPR